MNLDRFGSRLLSAVFSLAILEVSSASVPGQVISPKVAGGPSVAAGWGRAIAYVPILCGALLAAVFVLLVPVSAGAQCSTRWYADGPVMMRQRGQQFAIVLEIQHRGKVITGKAFHNASTPGPGTGGVRRVEGTVDGTLEGDNFSVQIFWPDQLTGVYTGKVLPSGRIDGETYDKNNSRNRQPWHSEGVLKCAPARNQNLFEQLNRTNSTTPTRTRSATTAPPQPRPPFIVASQSIFPSPNLPEGFAVLTWNVGPEHPYAELWVKINRGPDLLVAKQGFASTRQVPVQRGFNYIYILKENGNILAAVEFTAR